MRDEDRAKKLDDATTWLKRPMRWAIDFWLAPGPLRSIRKVPLSVIVFLMRAVMVVRGI